MNSLWGVLKSKTMWAAVVTAVLPFISEPVQDWITLHPGPYAALAAALMAALRFFTKDSLNEKGAEVVAKREAAAEDKAALKLPSQEKTP